MIKIFRNIRQNLLAEGKTTKYLQYALGEIVLVVIGILIALQINNWNEDSKLSNQERVYLQRLLLENQQDIITFDNSIQDLEKGNQSIDEMAKAFNKATITDSILLNSVQDYLNFGSRYPFFNPTTSTFEDLSSTGNLGVIEDTELRDLIVTHYAHYKSTESNFQVNTNWALPIDAPLYAENDLLKYEPTSAFLFGPTQSGLATNELKQNKGKFIRNAAVHYWVNSDCIRLLLNIKNETIKLIHKLELKLQIQEGNGANSHQNKP